MDGSNVGGDGFAGGFHEDDGVGGVDEVAVAVAHQLAELKAFVLDLFTGGGFHIADFGNGFGSEQGVGVFLYVSVVRLCDGDSHGC